MAAATDRWKKGRIIGWVGNVDLCSWAEGIASSFDLKNIMEKNANIRHTVQGCLLRRRQPSHYSTACYDKRSRWNGTVREESFTPPLCRRQKATAHKYIFEKLLNIGFTVNLLLAKHVLHNRSCCRQRLDVVACLMAFVFGRRRNKSV